MNAETAIVPFKVLGSAAAELHVPEMLDTIERQDTALHQIEALASANTRVGQLKTQACALLHAADQERQEVGYLPEETVDEAVAVGSEGHRAGRHTARIVEERAVAGERGIG